MSQLYSRKNNLKIEEESSAWRRFLPAAQESKSKMTLEALDFTTVTYLVECQDKLGDVRRVVGPSIRESHLGWVAVENKQRD